MATTSKAAAKTPAKPAASKPQEATAMLRADHKRVSDLFADYEITSSVSKKKDLVNTICKELSAHAQLEEEIFYPVVKRAPWGFGGQEQQCEAVARELRQRGRRTSRSRGRVAAYPARRGHDGDLTCHRPAAAGTPEPGERERLQVRHRRH